VPLSPPAASGHDLADFLSLMQHISARINAVLDASERAARYVLDSCQHWYRPITRSISQSL
jgi:hypothetical protein